VVCVPNNLQILHFDKICFVEFLRNGINHTDSIKRNIQEFCNSNAWIFFRDFFVTRNDFRTNEKYELHFSLGNVMMGITRTFVKYVHTHETRKLRSRVTMAYSGRAHGIEMKRYESRGNCPEMG